MIPYLLKCHYYALQCIYVCIPKLIYVNVLQWYFAFCLKRTFCLWNYSLFHLNVGFPPAKTKTYKLLFVALHSEETLAIVSSTASYMILALHWSLSFWFKYVTSNQIQCGENKHCTRNCTRHDLWVFFAFILIHSFELYACCNNFGSHGFILINPFSLF